MARNWPKSADVTWTYVAGARIIASPLAKKLAREANVDLSAATASGPDGRIVAADVQQLISSGAPSAARPLLGQAVQ